MNRPLLSIPQAAERLGIHRRTFERNVGTMGIPLVTVCGRRKVDPCDLEWWIQQNKRGRVSWYES